VDKLQFFNKNAKNNITDTDEIPASNLSLGLNIGDQGLKWLPVNPPF